LTVSQVKIMLALSTLVAAVAAFLSTPLGMTQRLISPTLTTETRVAAVRPVGEIKDDAKRFIGHLDKIRAQCQTNKWELKSSLFDGLRAGQTTVDQAALTKALKDQGFDTVRVVTARFQALDQGKEFNQINFMLIYGQDGKNWRLVEIEPLDNVDVGS
jgi:hypothetical protein